MPYERFGIGVGGCHVLLNGSNQLRYALETAPSYTLLCQFSEPSFHQIQPRRTRRGEVEREPRVVGEPPAHAGLGMGPIVVQNHMQRGFFRKLSVEPPQEAQEFLVPVLGIALPDHTSIQQVECCKEGRRPVPLVVVGHRPTSTPFHGQAGLGALEGLDLALLVHAQHRSLVRGIEIQPHHVGELLGKVGVFGELEPLGQVGW